MACGTCGTSNGNQAISESDNPSNGIYPSMKRGFNFCSSCFAFWVAIAIVTLFILSKKNQ